MTMIETDPVKFYVARFLFLAFAFVQWMVAIAVVAMHAFPDHEFLIPGLFVSLGFFFLYVFRIVTEKVKKVAIGKNKVVIMEGDRNSRFSWPEVKSVKIVPFLNLYRMKLRGKKNPIYFFPDREIDPALPLMEKNSVKGKPKQA